MNTEAFRKANKKFHAIEDQWHFPILLKYGFKSSTPPQQGFVRKYEYWHKDGTKVICTTGASADHWSSSVGSFGYWASLEPHLKNLAKK